MKLYYSKGACSLAPHILAQELGIPLTLVKVDLAAKKCEDGSDYWKINPKGYVPALATDDGKVITEVSAILMYLADLKGALYDKTETLEWLTYISTEIHKGFSPLWGLERMVPNKEGAEQLAAFNKERLAKRLEWVDQKLKGSFLTGNDFSLLDAYLFTVTRWAPYVGVDLSRFKNLEGYMGRMSQRPKLKAALQAEGIKA